MELQTVKWQFSKQIVLGKKLITFILRAQQESERIPVVLLSKALNSLNVMEFLA